jgi:DNA-binding CsgD family transcriptional regulator
MRGEYLSRPVDIVEAAYHLAHDDDTWLLNLARSAMPSLDRGEGVMGFLADIETRQVVASASTVSSSDYAAFFKRLVETAEGAVAEAYGADRGANFASVSGHLGLTGGHWDRWEAAASSLGFVDAVGLLSATGAGYSFAVWSPARHLLTKPTQRTVDWWRRLAAHIGAAYRLRRRFGSASAIDRAEAVLDPSGRVHHASASARERNAQSALREAVLAMERSRGPLRNEDAGRALTLWHALVAGQWSLVDHFDSDGRRFLVALANSPDNPDPRALRPREGAALRLAMEGASAKDIALALDISPSNARGLLSTAMRALGLESRADLFRFRADNARVLSEVDAEPALVALSLPHAMVDVPRAADLTASERELVSHLVAGDSNVEIARARGRSERTVANQVASILRKLDVHSRADVVALVTGNPKQIAERRDRKQAG